MKKKKIFMKILNTLINTTKMGQEMMKKMKSIQIWMMMKKRKKKIIKINNNGSTIDLLWKKMFLNGLSKYNISY